MSGQEQHYKRKHKKVTKKLKLDRVIQTKEHQPASQANILEKEMCLNSLGTEAQKADQN